MRRLSTAVVAAAAADDDDDDGDDDDDACSDSKVDYMAAGIEPTVMRANHSIE